MIPLVPGRVKKEKASRKRKAKDPNKPKRPTSAYFFYVAAKREEYKAAGKKITRVCIVWSTVS